MLSTRRLAPFRRHFRTTKSKREKEADDYFKDMKLKQQLFQKDDGLPVFLKGGRSDKFLFYSTLGLSAAGLGWSLAFIGSWAFPSKNKPEDQVDGDK